MDHATCRLRSVSHPYLTGVGVASASYGLCLRLTNGGLQETGAWFTLSFLAGMGLLSW